MNASGRRQRQAANGYAHLAPRQRPGYKMSDAATSRRRLEAQIATERRMSQGKKKAKGFSTLHFAIVLALAGATILFAIAAYGLAFGGCVRSAGSRPAVQQEAGGQAWAFVETKGGGHRGGGKKH